jgi:hypothetical protein
MDVLLGRAIDPDGRETPVTNEVFQPFYLSMELKG